MTKKIIQLVSMAAFFQSSIAIAQNVSLKSPYFIDGLHCSGLKYSAKKDIMKNSNSPEIASQVFDQINCEKIFSHFGIKKFSWLTPEDLELLTFRMNDTEAFDKVELSIKKSEIQNHIHLFAEIKPKSNQKYTLHNEAELQKGEKGQADRLSNKLELSFKEHRENMTIFEVGVGHEQSVAKKAYDISINKDAEYDKNLRTEDKLALAKKDHLFQHAFVKITEPHENHNQSEFTIQYLMGNSDAKSGYSEGMLYRYDYLIGSDHEYFFGIDNAFGISVMTYDGQIGDGYLDLTEESQQKLKTNDVTEKPKDINPIFVGAVFHLKRKSGILIDIKGEYFAGTGEFKNSRILNYDYYIGFGKIKDLIVHGLEFKGQDIRNSILPIHTHMFHSYSTMIAGYKFKTDNKTHNFYASIGSIQLDNNKYNHTEFHTSNFYGNFGYLVSYDLFDINLGFTYTAGRTF